MSSKNTMKKISLMLMFNVLLLLSFYSLTMEVTGVHEQAHKEIAQNHGCVDYEISRTLTAGGSFECLEYANRPESAKLQESELHSVNEIVGYNMSGLMSAIVIAVTLLMNTLFMRWILND